MDKEDIIEKLNEIRDKIHSLTETSNELDGQVEYLLLELENEEEEMENVWQY